MNLLVSKLAIVAKYDQYVEVEMKKMRDKVQESEVLVKQLKVYLFYNFMDYNNFHLY